jgi:hypothetical protein
MFLVRSIFWLTVAFLLIKPGVDLGRTAEDLSAKALTAGRSSKPRTCRKAAAAPAAAFFLKCVG